MNILLLTAAVLALAIAALAGFDIIHAAHTTGWLATGLTLGFASFLAGSWPNRG